MSFSTVDPTVPLVGGSAVNVASVPLRSPFRYPGGKTWLVPHIRQWLKSLKHRPSIFIEPFAGGGIVSLTVAFEGLSDKILMVELDDDVASVWETILGDDCNWFINRILSFDLNEENVRNELKRQNVELKERAFQVLLRNRTFHSGILAPGSTFLKSGEAGKGLASRWYPETLAKRISAIHEKRHRINFVHGNGLTAISQNLSTFDAAFFIDPPYTAGGKHSGKRLYTHHALDHDALFRLSSHISGDFLMTYDLSPEVIAMSRKFGFSIAGVPMKSTHHAVMYELIIAENLDWIKKTEFISKTRITDFLISTDIAE